MQHAGLLGVPRITRSTSRARNGGAPPEAYLLHTMYLSTDPNQRDERTKKRQKKAAAASQSRVRGGPYCVEDNTRGADGSNKSWYFDMVSMNRCDVLTVRLLRVEDLLPEDEKECPISMMDFGEATVDCLDEGAKLFPQLEDGKRCIGQLPCNHMFALLPLVYHAVLGSMRCPICRQGVEKRMRPSCLPTHVRQAFQEKLNKVQEQERQDIEEQSVALIRNMMVQESQHHNFLDFMELSSVFRVQANVGQQTLVLDGLPLRLTAFMYNNTSRDQQPETTPSSSTTTTDRPVCTMVLPMGLLEDEESYGPEEDDWEELVSVFEERTITGVLFLLHHLRDEDNTFLEVGRSHTLSQADIRNAEALGEDSMLRMRCVGGFMDISVNRQNSSQPAEEGEGASDGCMSLRSVRSFRWVPRM